MGTNIFGGIDPSYTTHFSDILQKKVFAKLGKTRYNKQEMADALSGYAYQDAQEWFAECMAEYYHSPSPREMCVTAIETMREILKGEGI